MTSFREAAAQSWRMVPLIIGALCLLLVSCADMKQRTGGEPRNKNTSHKLLTRILPILLLLPPRPPNPVSSACGIQ